MNLRKVLAMVFCLAASAGITVAAQPATAWIDVPFVTQTKDGCGSAAISMILRYWESQLGRTEAGPADPGRIQSVLYSPRAGGILASGMEEYFRSTGYRVYAFRGDWSELKRHLDAGRPLIVSLRAGGPWAPFHYVVVVGIDPVRGFVYLNDPAQKKLLRISREGFESEWNPTHNWTLLALPQQGD